MTALRRASQIGISTATVNGSRAIAKKWRSTQSGPWPLATDADRDVRLSQDGRFGIGYRRSPAAALPAARPRFDATQHSRCSLLLSSDQIVLPNRDPIGQGHLLSASHVTHPPPSAPCTTTKPT